MENPFETSPDITSCLVTFVDTNQYLFFGLVSKGWRKAWGKRPTKTKVVTADTSISQLLASLVSNAPLSGDICTAVAELGRLELLQVARRRLPLERPSLREGSPGRPPPCPPLGPRARLLLEPPDPRLGGQERAHGRSEMDREERGQACGGRVL